MGASDIYRVTKRLLENVGCGYAHSSAVDPEIQGSVLLSLSLLCVCEREIDLDGSFPKATV